MTASWRQAYIDEHGEDLPEIPQLEMGQPQMNAQELIDTGGSWSPTTRLLAMVKAIQLATNDLPSGDSPDRGGGVPIGVDSGPRPPRREH